MKQWFRDRTEGLRLRWQLAMHGEVMILNAIDAIQAAAHQLTYPIDQHACRSFLYDASLNLKQLINYIDEPEPTFPDEHEADGIVVPRDFQHQESM